jgi:pimeloyl-ACP methyl ester carboxylesterase
MRMKERRFSAGRGWIGLRVWPPAAILVVFAVLCSCRSGRTHEAGPRYDAAVYSELMDQYPTPVSLSPDGANVLVKTRNASDFEVGVVNAHDGRNVATMRNKNTQLSLTWRPDGKAIAYLMPNGIGRQYQLFLWEPFNGHNAPVPAPPTGTAAPPMRWSPDGARLAYFGGAGVTGRLIVVEFSKGARAFAALEGVQGDADFQWSPDGRRIALVLNGDPDAVHAIAVATGQDTRWPVSPAGEIRDLAWSPDGSALLFTIRPSNGEFFQLHSLNTRTGQSLRRASPNGDVLDPRWLADGRVLHTINAGEAVRLVGARPNGEVREIFSLESGLGRAELRGEAMGEGSLTFVWGGPTGPPRLFRVGRNGQVCPAYDSPRAGRLSAPPPERVTVASADGLQVPLCVWRSAKRNGMSRGVVVTVHGGPHLQEYPLWNELAAILTKRGYDMIAVNYRGSSGFGATFERANDDEQRVDDIVAACQYATSVLQAPSQRVVLFGSSFGANLAARAATRASQPVRSLVLVSFAGGRIPETALRPDFRAAVFHGDIDPILPPAAAKRAVENIIGSESHNSANREWRVFENEGHHFHYTASWAEVYSRILSFLNDGR